MPSVAAGDLLDALRAAGLRVTAPRRAVCDALAAAHDRHLTIAGLHELSEEKLGSSIDISTIYRTVDALEAEGLVHHVHLGHGPAVLHLSDHAEHHHLTCHICGKTIDLPLEDIRGLTEELGDRYGFEIDSAHFALIGRCSTHES